MRAYERLLNYVRVYTTSDPESGTHPSAAREFDLAHQLVEELKALAWRMPVWTSTATSTAACPPLPAARTSPHLASSPTWTTAPDASGDEREPHPARELRRL